MSGAGWTEFNWGGRRAWKRAWVDGNGVDMEERTLDNPFPSGDAATVESAPVGPDTTS